MCTNTTIQITDSISYLKASENPLSADIGIVKGCHSTYLFDLGNSQEALQLLETLSADRKELKAILSHFHPDHTGNLSKIKLAEIYVGANTYGYTHCGQIVNEDIYIEDGIRLHIFPLPSSHAKGCLGLEVNGEYAFLGDATYSTKKDGKIVYNATLLADEMRVLEKLKAKYFLLSHREKFVQRKEDVLRQLHKIYDRRVKGEPYIVLYQ